AGLLFRSNQRPNVVCSQLSTGLSYHDAAKTGGAVINQDCFGDAGDNIPGNAPRYFSKLRGDGIRNLDTSLTKEFTIREGKVLQVRAEMFNAFNHQRFAFPDVGSGDGALGTVTSTIYDFGSGSAVSERLYQGAFSADDYPSWNVVMALTPSREIVRNYGMGLITYVCDEVGPAKKEGETLAESIEKLVKIPLGTKLYIRVHWKDVQREPGKLELCEHWKLTFDLARRYQKRVGFRVMMSNPDIIDSPLPEFLRNKVPMV